MSSSDPIIRLDPDCRAAETSEFSPALPADLVRALKWLRGHLSEPIRLEQLAQVAGVRPRTLETHFKMFLGATPLSWARRMRLARARRELLRSGARTTVTDIAFANGFSQLGRFAAQYREVFGELPSGTISRTSAHRRTMLTKTSMRQFD